MDNIKFKRYLLIYKNRLIIQSNSHFFIKYMRDFHLSKNFSYDNYIDEYKKFKIIDIGRWLNVFC